MTKRNDGKRRSRYARQKQKQQYFLYGGLALALLIVIGLIVYSRLTAPPAVAEARLQEEAVRGAPGATVQIVEYGAYGCPACRAAHQTGILEQVMERYEGDVQFIFRNWPVIHPNDPNASEAAQCALDQGEGAFWLMHNALFDLSIGDYGRARDDEFVEMAAELGLDNDDLSLCLSERRHERTVDHWRDQGDDNTQVNVTPTFFVNEQRVGGVAEIEAAVITALEQ